MARGPGRGPKELTMANPHVDVELNLLSKGLTEGVEKASASFRSLGGTLSRYLGAAALGAAAHSVIAYASSLSDLSARAGVTMEWLQAAGYAAKMGGSSMDDLANAVTRLKVSMAAANAGNPKAIRAFKDLGLSVDDVKKQHPEKLFESIAAALEKAGGSADKVKAMIALLGPSSKKLIPSLMDDFKGTMDSARKGGLVASDEDILRADQMGDIWDTWMIQGKSKALGMLPTAQRWLGNLGISGAGLGRMAKDLMWDNNPIRRMLTGDFTGAGKASMGLMTGSGIRDAWDRMVEWQSDQIVTRDDRLEATKTALKKQADLRRKLASMNLEDVEEAAPGRGTLKTGDKFSRLGIGLTRPTSSGPIQVHDNRAMEQLTAMRQQLSELKERRTRGDYVTW